MAFYVFGNRLAVNRDHIESATIDPAPSADDPKFDIQIRTRSRYSVRVIVTAGELDKFLEWLRV